MGDLLREAVAETRTARLESIVVRLGNEKHARPTVGRLTREAGLVGDRWSAFRPVLDRQLTIMDVRVVRWLLAERRAKVAPQLLPYDELDLPGDNLVVDFPTGITSLPTGTRVRIGAALIEITELPHMGCKKFEARFGGDALAWVNDMAHYDLRLRGLNARVVEDGDVRVGDRVELSPGR